MEEYPLAASPRPAVIVAAVCPEVQTKLSRGFDLLGLPSALAGAGLLPHHAGWRQQGELRSGPLALEKGGELLPHLSVTLRVGEIKVGAWGGLQQTLGLPTA